MSSSSLAPFSSTAATCPSTTGLVRSVPERDDRRREDQILEHITGALQEAFGQSSGAARTASVSSTASPCAHRLGRALGLWMPIFAAILTLFVSSAAAAQIKPVSEFLQRNG